MKRNFSAAFILLALLSLNNKSMASDNDEASFFSAECQNTNETAFHIIEKCAKEEFAAYGAPINPVIIKEFLDLPSDRGSQIVSIDLVNSQNSNRFSLAGMNYSVQKYKDSFMVSVEADEDQQFSYAIEAMADNGVYVIKTSENFGGSGSFQSLLFLRVRDVMVPNMESKDIILPLKKRLVIESLAAFTLGDRADTTISVQGNVVDINTTDFKGNISNREIDLSLVQP